MKYATFKKWGLKLRLAILGIVSIALQGICHTDNIIGFQDSLPTQPIRETVDGYLGFVSRFHPSSLILSDEITYLDETGLKNTTWFEQQHTYAITLGNWHANGHVESYAVIPFNIRTRSQKVPAKVMAKWESGLGFGARFYPISVSESKFSPFLGYSVHAMKYTQSTITGATFTQTHCFSELEGGFILKTRYLNVWASVFGALDRELEVPLSRSESATVGLWPFGLQLGLTTTLFKLPEIQELTQPLSPEIRKMRLHGFNLGVGMSTAFPDRESRFIREWRPWLDQSPTSDLFPNFSLGYRFDVSCLEWSLSFGNTRQTRVADGYLLDLHHRVSTMELNYFIPKIKNWSPYFGLGLSYHDIQVIESDHGQSISNDHFNTYPLLFTLGCEWSSPSSSRWWVLSSRIRYFPWLRLNLRTAPMAGRQPLVPGNLQITILHLSYYPLRHYMAMKGRKRI